MSLVPIVTINVNDGTQEIGIPWSKMNAQTALEQAYLQVNNDAEFSFALQYFGELGYMVIMIDGVNDLPDKGMYWEFLVNGTPSDRGIDSYAVNPGDVLGFNNVAYSETQHAGTALQTKHAYYQRLKKK